MPNSQKICVIGSGLTALTIAYLLSKFRLQIDIVEKDPNKKKIKLDYESDNSILPQTDEKDVIITLVKKNIKLEKTIIEQQKVKYFKNHFKKKI